MRLPLPSSRSRRRRHAAGYTAVEVLMAMTVMVIGAAAVMSMQKAAVTGNLDARKTDMANNIARLWVERLQRDAMQWTCPSAACPTTNNMCATGAATGAQLICGNVTGLWFLPVAYLGKTTPESMSPGFDILGRDLPAAELVPSSASGWAGAQFCANVRLTWLVPPVPNPAGTTEPGLIRADVRVLWPRGIMGGSPAAGFCTAATAALADPEQSAPAGQTPFFHTIYMTTTLKESPAQ
ncbi:MAG TPA: prepilin-type N-terminal cleavage/methylation domain-containing protein [Polyangiaceae bacterium]|jgi:type II secretory pathway pseudopilin PulG